MHAAHMLLHIKHSAGLAAWRMTSSCCARQGTIANVDYVGPWELPYNEYLTTADLYGRCACMQCMHACMLAVRTWLSPGTCKAGRSLSRLL